MSTQESEPRPTKPYVIFLDADEPGRRRSAPVEPVAIATWEEAVSEVDSYLLAHELDPGPPNWIVGRIADAKTGSVVAHVTSDGRVWGLGGGEILVDWTKIPPRPHCQETFDKLVDRARMGGSPTARDFLDLARELRWLRARDLDVDPQTRSWLRKHPNLVHELYEALHRIGAALAPGESKRVSGFRPLRVVQIAETFAATVREARDVLHRATTG